MLLQEIDSTNAEQDVTGLISGCSICDVTLLAVTILVFWCQKWPYLEERVELSKR